MDIEIARLAARGITATCPNRTIGGWPFRLDIDCDEPSLFQADQLTSVKLKHLRLTALIYNPTLVVAELDSPLTATGPKGEQVNANWSLLQASLGLSISPAIQPDRLAFVTDALSADVTRPTGQPLKLVSSHAEFHGRPSPDAGVGSTDIDAAISLTAATLSSADRPIGPEGVDWFVGLTARHLPHGAGNDGFPRAWAANQAHVDVRSAKMALGGFTLEGMGGIDLLYDGILDGRIKLTATNLQSLMAPGAQSGKGRAELLGLATAFTIFGKPAPDAPPGSRSLDLVVDHSQVKIGPTGLGRIPPLF
jgi:hypothetical protein